MTSFEEPRGDAELENVVGNANVLEEVAHLQFNDQKRILEKACLLHLMMFWRDSKGSRKASLKFDVLYYCCCRGESEEFVADRLELKVGYVKTLKSRAVHICKALLHQADSTACGTVSATPKRLDRLLADIRRQPYCNIKETDVTVDCTEAAYINIAAMNLASLVRGPFFYQAMVDEITKGLRNGLSSADAAKKLGKRFKIVGSPELLAHLALTLQKERKRLWRTAVGLCTGELAGLPPVDDLVTWLNDEIERPWQQPKIKIHTDLNVNRAPGSNVNIAAKHLATLVRGPFFYQPMVDEIANGFRSGLIDIRAAENLGKRFNAASSRDLLAHLAFILENERPDLWSTAVGLCTGNLAGLPPVDDLVTWLDERIKRARLIQGRHIENAINRLPEYHAKVVAYFYLTDVLGDPRSHDITKFKTLKSLDLKYRPNLKPAREPGPAREEALGALAYWIKKEVFVP